MERKQMFYLDFIILINKIEDLMVIRADNEYFQHENKLKLSCSRKLLVSNSF